MKLTTAAFDVSACPGGLLAVGRATAGSPSAAERALDHALDGALTHAAKRQRFRGKPREVITVDTLGRLAAERVALIGLGEPDALGPAQHRDFAALALGAAEAAHLPVVGLVLPDGSPDEVARELACGALLGAYRFDALKSDDPDSPPPRFDETVLLTADDPGDAVGGAVDRGRLLAEAVNLARTLTNEPPNVCTPTRLADLAGEIAREHGLELTVLGPEEISARAMGGVEAVGKGAAEPPRFIHLTWRPEGARDADAIAFVGKGVTFDSGGLNLKPGKSMADMHIDMSGAGAVLAAMKAIGQLRPPVVVHGIVAAVENMPGGRAYHPSDILTMYSGKTVEVRNTDAEGRLVLADALHYAAELKPRCVIDLATLTGACMIALGPFYGGLFGSDDALSDKLLAAARHAGELFWRLPLDAKLKDQLKSKRADITNLGGPWGGAITGALFLQEFAGDRPWLHLDIAGAVLAEKTDGHVRAGGTGFAVLTLAAFATGAASKG